MGIQVETFTRNGLVKWIEDDIRSRGLRPGDQYLTAHEVGALFGVSSVTASRAMNVLAGRHMLMRRKRQGTFIGPKIQPVLVSASPCVHCLTFFDDISSDMALFIGEVMSGLNLALPGVAVKTHFGPVHDALAHIRKEVEQVSSDPAFAGFILWLGIREVQEFLAGTGLPVVVHGGVYPGIDLPFVEHDQQEIGRLMAREAIAAGHRRLVFVNRQTWRRGDSLALDGILEAIQEAGLGANVLHVRNMGVSSGAIRKECGHLLDEFAGPTAFLCRNGFFVPALADTAKSRGLKSAKDICMVWDATGGGYATLAEPVMRAFVAPQWTQLEEYRRVGEMLAQMGKGMKPQPEGSIVPVKIVRRTR